MVYKKIQNEMGDYIDSNNVRFDVLEAHEAWTPKGKNVGWDEFSDKETALASYGLTWTPVEEV